jgi:hypothetical protein
VEVYWTPENSIPEYDLTIDITDISMVSVNGPGAGSIDATQTSATKSNNPPIYVPEKSFATVTAGAIGTVGAVVTSTGAVAAVAIGACGISFMYLSRMI